MCAYIMYVNEFMVGEKVPICEGTVVCLHPLSLATSSSLVVLWAAYLCMYCWVFICANFYVNFIGIIEGRTVLKANLFIDVSL